MDCNQSIPHELVCVFSSVHTIFSPTANAIGRANSILLRMDKVSILALSLRLLHSVLGYVERTKTHLHAAVSFMHHRSWHQCSEPLWFLDDYVGDPTRKIPRSKLKSPK